MKEPTSRNTGSAHADKLTAISQELLRCANRGVAWIEFLTDASNALLKFSQCDALGLRLKSPSLSYLWDFAVRPTRSSRLTVLDGRAKRRLSNSGSKVRPHSLEGLCRDLIAGRRVRPEAPFRATRGGSLWTTSLDAHDAPRPGARSEKRTGGAVESTPYSSIALIPFTVDDRSVGLLQLKSTRKHSFTARKVEFCERIAQNLGLAIANRGAQWALRERVKELTSLYEIGRIAQLRGIPLDEVLQRIVEVLPPAWQFPDIACGRIILDGRAYTTASFRPGPHRQAVDLVVQGRTRGTIEVVYTENRPEFAEGPFLLEERSLIETIAREVALIVERRNWEEEQLRLQAQLRHADRLATIGQLAAGVAHELNEPLGSILGFAQLIQKAPRLSGETASDVAKIVKATLLAREVIHKLLVFSRQQTPVKTEVNLNRVVQDGLYFLESRCARAGIEVQASLASDLPDIQADGSQLHQVVVNLVVNSIQAMPEGGVLTIQTHAAPGFVVLSVADTGCGMTDEIKEKIFTPFFTTKDVDQGTGLGLAVVHGIISAHGGSILVESAPGRGSRFEIRLPSGGKSEAEENG